LTSEAPHNGIQAEADKLVKNNILTMIARFGGLIAAPLLLGAFGVFGWYVTTTSDAISSASRVSAELASTVDDVTERVTVIETRINIGQRNREEFQDQVLETLAEIQRTQTLILQKQAAQDARFDGVEKRLDRSGN
jgi:hypothetical protein